MLDPDLLSGTVWVVINRLGHSPGFTRLRRVGPAHTPADIITDGLAGFTHQIPPALNDIQEPND